MHYYTYAYLREDRTPYYIGKGTGRRIYSTNRKGLNPPKDKSRIIFLKQNLTEEEAFKHEKYMIAVFGRKDLGTGILCNRTDGGEGTSNPSEETRRKLSEAHKGKTHSNETRQKISKKKKGKKNTTEHNEKVRLSSKIGEINRSLWKITFADGNVIYLHGVYKWANENKYNSSHIGKVASGKLKRHKDIVAVEKLAHLPTTKENFDV